MNSCCWFREHCSWEPLPSSVTRYCSAAMSPSEITPAKCHTSTVVVSGTALNLHIWNGSMITSQHPPFQMWGWANGLGQSLGRNVGGTVELRVSNVGDWHPPHRWVVKLVLFLHQMLSLCQDDSFMPVSCSWIGISELTQQKIWQSTTN